MTNTNLSDLPEATSVSPGDLFLIRKNLTDYRIAASVVQAINIGPLFLGPIPGGSALDNDLMLISRPNISGAYQNYNIRFNQVGLLKGVMMWFYAASPPLGWTLVPKTGNSLIACADLSAAPYGKYSGSAGGNNAGTWQQEGVGGGSPGGGLTPAQLPPHTHNIKASSDNLSSGNQDYARTGKSNHDVGTINTSDGGPSLLGEPHNHGSTWRPMANVGCIGIKGG